MNDTPILVAYATKHGATLDIAVEIAATLRATGLTVTVAPVTEVTELKPYRAVVFGSAVYAGQWRREAVQFLDAHYIELAQLPVWVFSSGPTGVGDPLELLDGWHVPEDKENLIERIDPEDVVVFHGKIDRDRLNMAERLMVRAVKAPTGDFRDWAAIRAWADEIAAVLTRSDVPTGT